MEHASVKVVVWNRKNKLLNEQTLLNPAASHDKAIVCNNTKEENEKDGFLKMLRMGIQNLRGCWLFKDDCDVLTVDFYAAF